MFDGQFTQIAIPMFDTVEVTQNQGPNTQCQLTNYPNPFNPSTTISFSLTAEDAENAELVIYNIKGQKVKTLYPFPNRGLGTRSVVWNGKDENNKAVASGIYFYKITAGKSSAMKKMLLLK